MLPGVIIVDDSEEDRYLARRAIAGAGLAEKVVEITDGDGLMPMLEDRERLRSECGEPPPPILILLDINMPRQNGFEVLEELERRYGAEGFGESCFVLMMFTSSDNPEDRRRALGYAFVKDYLVKPVSAEGLRVLVEEHCPEAFAESAGGGRGAS